MKPFKCSDGRDSVGEVARRGRGGAVHELRSEIEKEREETVRAGVLQLGPHISGICNLVPELYWIQKLEGFWC